MITRTTHWTAPPRCQGQSVEYAYALGVDNLDHVFALERRRDADGSVSYRYRRTTAEEDWAPWNAQPTMAGAVSLDHQP